MGRAIAGAARRFAPGAALAAWLLAAPFATAQEGEPVRLGTGGQTVLDVRDVVRVSVGDPAVADVQLTEDESQLIVTARAPGATDVILWDAAGATRRLRVLVGGLDPAELAASLRGMLDDVEGIEVREVGGRVVLDGRVLTREDLDRVSRVAQAYADVVNLVRLDLTAHNDLLAREISLRIGYPSVTVAVVGDRVILGGTVFREEDRALAATVAGAFAPQVVNLLQVETPMVEVDARFVQVDVERSHTSGLDALSGASAGVGASGPPGSPQFTLQANVPLAVGRMIGTGTATVLAEPFLTAVSGQEATFHSGGEQGYRVAGASSADVEFKRYGLILSVRPEVQSSGEIRLRLALEVSVPTSEAGAEDMSFQTFSTQTEMVCRINESLVVSGLARSLQNRFRERTPVLGSIPVLGGFFRGSAESLTHQDILLIVTPRVPLLERAPDEAASERIRDRLPAPSPAVPPRGPDPARPRIPPRGR